MEGFVKINELAARISEHPMLRDITFDRIIRYTVELIQVTGSPKLFYEKTAIVSIHNYRGELPCDFIEMIQVRGIDHSEYFYSMDSFHTSPNKDFVGANSYKIQGGIIVTSNEHCDVEIAYRALALDEDGWPLIPDNASFMRALESYVKMKQFNILFDQGQISQNVFEQAQRDYYANIAQAETEFVLPSVDQMETVLSIWNRMIPRMVEHSNGFRTTHNRQYLKRH